MEEKTMKEMCLEELKNMGFQTEYHEGLGYGFSYEGHNYLFMPNDNDEQYLCISLPGVMEMGDVPEETFYKVMDKMNATLKYIKTNTLHDDMWIFYERELIGEEDISAVLRRMILRLDSALVLLRQEMKKAEESDEEIIEEINDEDETDDNEADDAPCASQFPCDDNDETEDDPRASQVPSDDNDEETTE